MSAGEVSAALSVLRARIGGAARQLTSNAEALATRQALLARLLHGSNHPTIARIMAGLSAAGVRLRESAVDAKAATDAITAYQAALTGTSSGVPDVTAGTGRASVVAPLPPIGRYDMAKATEIRGYVDRDKTVGRLYTGDGTPLSDIIYSGTTGPGATGVGLGTPWRNLESLTQHTEGHAAAMMRTQQVRDAVLYLSKHPCKPPAGCHQNIDKALPAGSRLTVWVVNADGSVLRRVYIGTGEAITA